MPFRISFPCGVILRTWRMVKMNGGGIAGMSALAEARRLGIDARMNAEGLIEEGFNLADGERLIRIDIAKLKPKPLDGRSRQQV